MRRAPMLLIAALLAAAPVLSACQNFDPDNLDFFGLNEKKKLPGDRRAVFPEGVPGVTQGVPPEYIKGNQPPPEAALAAPAQPGADPNAAAPVPEQAPAQAATQGTAKPRVTNRPTRIP